MKFYIIGKRREYQECEFEKRASKLYCPAGHLKTFSTLNPKLGSKYA